MDAAWRRAAWPAVLRYSPELGERRTCANRGRGGSGSIGESLASRESDAVGEATVRGRLCLAACAGNSLSTRCSEHRGAPSTTVCESCFVANRRNQIRKLESHPIAPPCARRDGPLDTVRRPSGVGTSKWRAVQACNICRHGTYQVFRGRLPASSRKEVSRAGAR